MLPRRFQRLRDVLDKRQPDLTVLMENVRKPHNFSAILRTCDAIGMFEAHAVTNDGQLPTFNSTAQGSQKWIAVQLHASIEVAIQTLKSENFQIYAAHFSEQAIDYRTVDYTQPSAIVFGAERWGVSETAATLTTQHIFIPMIGMVQSLNVSVATAVILFEAQRQRAAAGFYDRPRLDPDRYHRTLFEWAYPDLAKQYQRQDKAYPTLGDDGEIMEN